MSDYALAFVIAIVVLGGAGLLGWLIEKIVSSTWD